MSNKIGAHLLYREIGGLENGKWEMGAREWELGAGDTRPRSRELQPGSGDWEGKVDCRGLDAVVLQDEDQEQDPD